MTFLNEYEAADAQRIVTDAGLPNLALGADVIGHLIDWANSNSDGWVYWKKPRQAADKLCTQLEEARRAYLKGNGILDLTDAELAASLRPIKAFLTRQLIDYHAELPWAAILPAA